MTTKPSILRRLESLEVSAYIVPPDSCRDELSGEIRALLAAVPRGDDRTALLRRLDDGSATDADRIRLARCSADTLRIVIWLDDKT